MFEEYRETLGDRGAVRRLCMKFDLYWNDAIFNSASSSDNTRSIIRSYIGKTNLYRYVNKSFDDTLDEEKAVLGDSGQEGTETGQVNPDVIRFWGAGYTPDFYEELQRRYQDWTGGAEIQEPNKRSLYRQICLLEATIARDGAQGKPINLNVGALNNLIGSMNLKPAQQKEETDTELEKMPLGVGIQKWEYSRPLPETPPELRDVRGTVRNISTWFLGHLCKMVGVKNGYSKLYEDAMEKLRVKRPEGGELDDDEMLMDYCGLDAGGGDG